MTADSRPGITLSSEAFDEALGLLDALGTARLSVQRMAAARLRRMGIPASARSRSAFDARLARGELHVADAARAQIAPHSAGHVFRVAVGVTGQSVDETWSAFDQRYHWFGKKPQAVTSGSHLFVLAVDRWRSAVVGLYETVSAGADRLPDSPDPDRWPWAIGVRPRAAIPPPEAERVEGQTGPQSGLPERIYEDADRRLLYAAVRDSQPPPGPRTLEQRVQELEPQDVVDDILLAIASLGPQARRRAVLDAATELGGWTSDELSARAWHTGGETRSHVKHILARALDHEHVMTRRVTRAHGSSPFALAPAVALPLGAPYRPAAGRRSAIDDERAHLVDVASLEKATVRHMRLQDHLARELRRKGCEPRSPNPLEPQYDLAFERDGVVFLVEVKTGDPPTPQQVRIGAGQVLEYRHLIATARRLGPSKVRPVLALEAPPPDPWAALSRELGIEVVTTDDLAGSLARILTE